MTAGRLSGLVAIRPVRMGLVVPAEMPALRQAATWATSAWGGAYTPILDQARPDSALRIADRLGVDALYAVADEASAQELANSPGYQWHGRGEWGPYEQPKEYLSARLLGPERLLDRTPVDAELALARWSDDDPLADLLTIWLGAYGDGEYQQSLDARFADRATVSDIDASGTLPLTGRISPIALTAQDITYSGDVGPRGFVVLDPDNPVDLMTFWNARAFGGTVFPWPLGHTDRIRDLARRWLEEQTEAGTFSGWLRGDGQPLPPQASVVLRASDTSVPGDLADLLASAGVNPMPDSIFTPRGWNGIHPLRTDFQCSFAVDVDSTEWSVNIALPEFVPGLRRDPIAGAMIVAAHIEVFQEHGLGATRWVAVPNVRILSTMLTGSQLRSSVRRPASSGRVLAVAASSEDVVLEVLPAMQVVAKLFEGSPWEANQSDNGSFAGRLSELLGGPGTTSASEPALREVLASTVRSPVGKSVRELQTTAKEYRGTWPPTLSRFTTPDDYAENVVLRLLHRKLLRPHLSVRCPTCALAMTMRPEDLATSMNCEMCSAEFPLGYALALGKGRQASWRYRLPPDIGEDRILEATALLATAAAIGPGELLDRVSPHQFGIELSPRRQRGRTPSRYCELDILMVLDDRGQSEIVVGEVKNKGYLEPKDLEHLLRVQQWFLDSGIHCYPLFASLRDALREEEISLLRAACENSPRSLGNQIYPLAPIVLLKPDLSVAPMESERPRSWRSGGDPWGNFAVESCKRNLGLLELTGSSGMSGDRRPW